MGKIILTGDRPTGRLHVGHYVGSLKRRVELQNSGQFDEIYIMIADAQALTDNADNPEKVRQNIIEVALDYLSLWSGPGEIHIIYPVPGTGALTELTFYYMDLVTVSRLTAKSNCEEPRSRCVTFEASIPVGFFTYPISQAADITAFKATTVPVGEDQASDDRADSERSSASFIPYLRRSNLVEPDDPAARQQSMSASARHRRKGKNEQVLRITASI